MIAAAYARGFSRCCASPLCGADTHLDLGRLSAVAELHGV